MAAILVAAAGCAGGRDRSSVPPDGRAAVPAGPSSTAGARPVGPRTPVVLHPPSPNFDIVDLVVDTRRAYWAYRGDRGLVSIPLSGGSPGGAATTLVAATDHAISSLAAAGEFLYWTSGRRVGTDASVEMLGRVNQYAGHYEGFVARIQKDGKGQTELSSGRFEPDNVAVDGANVYWVMVRPKEGTLVRLPPGTDAPSVVAHGSFAPGSLVVHSGHAYWIDASSKGGPTVMMVSIAGEEPKKLAQGEAGHPVHPVRLAADDVAVYWTDTGWSEAGGALVKVPVGAGNATLLAEGLRSPRGVQVSGGFVYWLEKGTAAANFHDGTLRRVPVQGGAAETLATGLFAPDRLATAAGRVCWTEVDGSVKTLGE